MLLIDNEYLKATFIYAGSNVQFTISILKNLPLGTMTTMYTLPIEYRPMHRYIITFGDAGAVPNIRVFIDPDGLVRAYLYNNSGYGNAMESGSYIRSYDE